MSELFFRSVYQVGKLDFLECGFLAFFLKERRRRKIFIGGGNRHISYSSGLFGTFLLFLNCGLFYLFFINIKIF